MLRESRGVSDRPQLGFRSPLLRAALSGIAQRHGLFLARGRLERRRLESARLLQLANAYTVSSGGHRALNDCEAAVELLARPLPRSGRIGAERAARIPHRRPRCGGSARKPHPMPSVKFSSAEATDGRPATARGAAHGASRSPRRPSKPSASFSEAISTVEATPQSTHAC